jgi:AcrR family transcriptional regulator
MKTDLLLPRLAAALAQDPALSLTELAATVGVSRTTLFTRFATREALLRALAEDALDLVAAAYQDAGMHADTTDPLRVLRHLTERLLPLGPRMAFLVRALPQDPGLAERLAALDQPLLALLNSARLAGDLRADVNPRWLLACLDAALVAAWQAIEDGALAPLDAADAVLSLLLDGARPR